MVKSKEKVYSVMSHAERKQRCSELENKNLTKDYSAFVEKVHEEYFEMDDSGRAVKKVRVKSIPVKGRNKDYKVNDFCMDNLVAIGAEGTLQYSTFKGSLIDIDNSLKSIDALMDRVDLDIANANADVNVNVEE